MAGGWITMRVELTRCIKIVARDKCTNGRLNISYCWNVEPIVLMVVSIHYCNYLSRTIFRFFSQLTDTSFSSLILPGPYGFLLSNSCFSSSCIQANHSYYANYVMPEITRVMILIRLNYEIINLVINQINEMIL